MQIAANRTSFATSYRKCRHPATSANCSMQASPAAAAPFAKSMKNHLYFLL
jgi:hypothetical protein